MGEPIRIELRGEPVAKQRPRFSRKSGVAYTPSKTRTAESVLRLAAHKAMGSRKPIDGPVRLDVMVRLAVPRSWSKRKQAEALLGLILPTNKSDWDNYGKLASDSLNQICYRDDAQVVEATVCKRYSARPSLTILVREIAPAGQRDAA